MTNQYENSTQWQPIETAPKDGNEVILFDPDYLQRSGFEGRYSEPRGSWLSSYGSPVNPTHWMPLPEPPQEKGSGWWPEVPKNGGPDWTGFDG